MSLRSGCAAAAIVLSMGMLDTADAGLYRCPSLSDGGTVTTNLVRETDALERGCQPLQQRRSPLDTERTQVPKTLGAPTAISDAGRAAGAAHSSPEVQPGQGLKKNSSPPSEHLVAQETQRERDVERHRILEREIETERLAVTESRQRSLAAAAGSAERQRLDEGLARHVSDVEALQRELARIR